MTALRVICAYRTVSLDAALLLAGVLPFSMLVSTRMRIYHRLEMLKREDFLTVRVTKQIRTEEFAAMREEWRTYLLRPNLAGARTIEAVRPHFDSWLDRKYGGLSFRMTQLLTGHGCFGSFLYRIRRSPTPVCYHCLSQTDTAEHTLSECREWSIERADLQAAIGLDVTLPNIVGVISASREAWRAFRLFAERTMLVKEEAERQRQIESAGLDPQEDDPDDPDRIADESGDGDNYSPSPVCFDSCLLWSNPCMFFYGSLSCSPSAAVFVVYVHVAVAACAVVRVFVRYCDMSPYV